MVLSPKWQRLYNINIMGIGFMLVFSAFLTASFIEGIVFKDMKGVHGITKKTAFYSLAIIYAFLGVANWFSPAIVKRLGSKWALVLSSLPYVGFIFSMYEPYMASVFVMSALLGTGGGIMWTANGEIIARNSPGESKAKNTGIFWSWFNTSMLVGNIFLFFYLGDSEAINAKERHVIYLVLGTLCTLGMFCFLLLQPPPPATKEDGEEGGEEGGNLQVVTPPEAQESIIQPIKDAMRFCCSWQMGLLYMPFIFSGVSLNFWSSVFITIIGEVFSKRSYIALGGIATGIGEISAGFIWGRLSTKIGRHGVVMCSTVILCILYYLAFISFPFDAATATTTRATDKPIIPSNLYLTLAMGVLLGLGDGGFNVSIYANLSTVFEHKPAPAFAVFKFVQSLMGAGAFLYCGSLQLPYQLAILAVTCLLACFSFTYLERFPQRVLVFLTDGEE